MSFLQRTVITLVIFQLTGGPASYAELSAADAKDVLLRAANWTTENVGRTILEGGQRVGSQAVDEGKIFIDKSMSSMSEASLAFLNGIQLQVQAQDFTVGDLAVPEVPSTGKKLLEINVLLAP